MIKCYSREYGLSPEDVVLEKERRGLLVQLMKDVMLILSKRNRKILWLYIKGYTQKQIAEKVGITQPAICQRLNKIPAIVKKRLSPHHIILLKEYLLDNPSRTKSGTPKELLGWPVIFLQHVGIEGQWGTIRGKQVYKSKTECRMIEYLKCGFHEDDLPKCCLCGKKCTRTENNLI